MSDKYFSEDLTFTQNGIESIRKRFQIPTLSVIEIQRDFSYLKTEFIELILSDLKNDFELGVRLFAVTPTAGNGQTENYTIGKILTSNNYIFDYIFNQLNTLFKAFLFGTANDDMLVKELVDEKTSFYIKFNENGINQMGEMIINESDLAKTFDFLNEQLYIKNINESLLKKIPQGKNNKYLDFLSESIRYLGVKVSNSNYIFSNSSSIVFPNQSIITLGDLFKDKNIYQLFISFMIAKKYIRSGNNTLIWRGIRRGAKYEISSLHEALYESGLLKAKAANDAYLITIASNTFYYFKATERTMRRKDDNGAWEHYRSILKEFKSSLA